MFLFKRYTLTFEIFSCVYLFIVREKVEKTRTGLNGFVLFSLDKSLNNSHFIFLFKLNRQVLDNVNFTNKFIERKVLKN